MKMACINVDALNLNDELSIVNLSLYENNIEHWRAEQKCLLKLKSIENIEKSTIQVNIENKWLENQLQEKKSRIEEIKEYIVSMDNIILSFYETLAHLKIEHKKKEFSISKSKNDYELQLFIRMELWKKEEEWIDNIPEVKSLKVTNSELNNIILEYEGLLDYQKYLIEKIKKTQKQNNEKLNDNVVEFAKVYTEMLTLNKREKHCLSLLRKQNTEYNDKFNMKNELLEFSKKEINKISFWTHIFCPFDSKIIDNKLDSLSQELKPHLNYSNSHDFPDIQKLNNEKVLISNKKLKKKVSFLLPSEDQISRANNDILNECEYNKNINLVKNISNNDIDSYTNSSFTKDDTLVNKNITQQYQKQICKEPSTMIFHNNKKQIDEHNFEVNNNKLKITEASSDFEFKKPYKPVQQENQMNRNLIRKTFQPSTTKIENIHMENNVDEHQEKEVQSLNLLINNYKHKGSCQCNDIHLQEKSSLESADQPNLKNFYYENSKIFELQSNETSSDPNNEFSSSFLNDYGELASQYSLNSSFCGSDLSDISENAYYDISQDPNMELNFFNSLNNLFLNDYDEQMSQNSINSSFRDSNLSELFVNSNGISQYPNMQLNFLNSFNTNSNATSKSNLQE